jgi:hypothetical protein
MSDVRELIERLRANGTANAPHNSNGIYMSICDDAAAALERLSAEMDAAREALRHLPGVAENFMRRFNVHDLPESDAQQWQALEHEIARARAVLKAEPVEPSHEQCIILDDQPL